MSDFTKRLNEAFGDSGLTEQQLADIMLVSQQAVNHWLRGIAKPKKMHDLARVLKVSLDWLEHNKGPKARPEDNPLVGVIGKITESLEGKYLELAHDYMQSLKETQDKAKKK